MPRMPTGQYARTVGELLDAAAEAEQRASVAFAAGAEWMRIFQTMHEQAAAWRAHAAAAQAHDLQMVEILSEAVAEKPARTPNYSVYGSSISIARQGPPPGN
jgi:hypothetical protein